jgi:hypothetical protein
MGTEDILLVDDSVSQLHLLSMLPESEGFDVTAVSDGFKALEVLRNNKFRIIIPRKRDFFVLARLSRVSTLTLSLSLWERAMSTLPQTGGDRERDCYAAQVNPKTYTARADEARF